MSEKLKIGIVTVSDRASRGEYEDKGGPAVHAELKEMLLSEFDVITKIVPDEKDILNNTLTELADNAECSLVITTGGTGPAPRDITPDVTQEVCERILPGFGELMRQVSLKKVPTAILSRQIAGTRGSTLIINLPGKPSAIKECLEAVMPAIPDCIDLLGGPRVEANPEKVRVHTPHRS
ncbi:MAG: molybdopterin adenylyltransferase [Deltaproteobacteria bacterium]|nr:molybdopterin adenylyltransferase [Deltaproteobacteria bacterium]